jgi:hypothetical protein
MDMDERISALIAVSSANILVRASYPPRPGSAARFSSVLSAESQWAGGVRTERDCPGGNVDGDENRATRSYATKLRYVCETANIPGRAVGENTLTEMYMSNAVRRFAPGLSRQSAVRMCTNVKESLALTRPYFPWSANAMACILALA